ncbi:hypothetical protein M422DRAFT_785877 [Sphaerobolus stellatus SS14]|uniref:Uncharacterized protein n=1 Tax=Sphaerobolus stellatus (strain SS14) TaxID=990650 RepID=A0A0C9TR71_SPHS4|nr:hypothetical protein M422DRAFT_785877 [Sphaerobolus stellatus SS14]
MDSIPSRCIIQVLRDPESSHQLRPLRILRTLWLTLCLHRHGLKIFLWGGTSGECLAEFKNAHKGSVYTGSWSSGSRNIVTSSADCTVKISAFHQLGNTWTNKDVVASLSIDVVLNVFDPRNGDGPIALCMLSALPTPHPRILTSSLIQGPLKPITPATLISSLPTISMLTCSQINLCRNNLPTPGYRRFLPELSYKYSATFKAHTNFVHSASHAPSGSHFVSTGADYKVFLWYSTSGERGAGFENVHEGGVAHGPRIARASWPLPPTAQSRSGMSKPAKHHKLDTRLNSAVNVFDPCNGGPVRVSRGPQKAITAATLVPSLPTLFTSTGNVSTLYPL